ncbi:MAG: restriction endonuclease [Phycisphaeraceae bacterium]|nr:restriction endonuclease [Phycisphaeraceae bacterium]
MSKAYQDHLKSSRDLETTYEAVRAGFVSLALEKNRRATPYVAEARALKSAASKAKSPIDLLAIPAIRAGLLAAAGISDKAAGHLQESDRDDAIAGLIGKFLEPAGANFVEELVFRFLLTRGDALGGSMRNVGGFMAQRKLTRALIAQLNISGTRYRWLSSDSKAWADKPEDDMDIEINLRGIAWGVGSLARVLIYNLTVPLFGNNVDLCLFRCESEAMCRDVHADPDAYVALGELKGGIDPAGADEHWKTARTALGRVRKAFCTQQPPPHAFFIGAAIETKMAGEIWKMLQRGDLQNAANLTNDEQISSITRWICSL